MAEGGVAHFTCNFSIWVEVAARGGVGSYCVFLGWWSCHAPVNVKKLTTSQPIGAFSVRIEQPLVSTKPSLVKYVSSQFEQLLKILYVLLASTTQA